MRSGAVTSLDGGVAKGYVDVPKVERAVTVHSRQLPLGQVDQGSLSRLVSSLRHLFRRLIVLLVKLFPPSTLWRSFRFFRPRL